MITFLAKVIIMVGTLALPHAFLKCDEVPGIAQDGEAISGDMVADSRGVIVLEVVDQSVFNCHAFKDARYTEWWGEIYWSKGQREIVIKLKLAR